LRLNGAAVEKQVDGIPKLVIDGTSSFSVDLSDLDEVADEILLSSLNGGEGVSAGSFLITDTDGNSAAIVINSSVQTVDDVIDLVNAKNIGVEARINDAGTGILLYDTAGGSEILKVEDLGSGTAAADLGFDADVTTIEIEGEPRKAINGAGTFSKTVAQTGLAALAEKINNLEAGVTASTIYDGTGYRLLLSVDKTGAANELLVDGADAGLDFSELSAARDAVLEIGTLNGGTGLVVTSADNTFSDVVPGLELTVLAESEANVRVDVAKAQTQLTGAIEDFVDAFNSIQTNLDEVTAFDQEQLTTGILFGTSAALRVESDLNHLLSGRFFGVGQFTSLEAVGLSFTGDGKLRLSTAKLQEALDTDAAAVERLFTDENSGLAAKLKSTFERLAGDDNSVLESRAKSLADIIKANSERIKFMDERLTRERERLLLTFAQLESTIAAMQANMTALAGLQPVPPLTG
jgi:flagellar hook-associated protein 2